MIVLSIIAALLFVGMLCVVVNKYGMPDMVSSIYYLLGKRGWVFQAVMIAVGALMMVCMLDSGRGIECLAFLAGAGLMFVGAAPRFLDSGQRKVHKTGATVCALASVGWCLSVQPLLTLLFVAWYVFYLIVRDKDSKPWLVAELTAMMLVLLTYWSGIEL